MVKEQWLAALQQDLGQFSALTRQLKALCNSSSKESDALFWPSKALHAPGALTWRQSTEHLNPLLFSPSMFLMDLAGIQNHQSPARQRATAGGTAGEWEGSMCPEPDKPQSMLGTKIHSQHLPVQNAGFYSSPGSVTAWGVLMWDLLPHSREVIHKSQSWACKNTSHVSTISQGLTVGSDFRWITPVCLGERHMVFQSCDSLHGNTNPAKS